MALSDLGFTGGTHRIDSMVCLQLQTSNSILPYFSLDMVLSQKLQFLCH